MSDELHVSFNGIRIPQIMIYDVLGNLVLKEKILNPAVNNLLVSKGLFFLEIESDKDKIIEKYVKS